MHMRFDAGSHPSPKERTEAWRLAMSVSMEIRFEPADVEGFAGGLDLFAFGPATLGIIRGTAHSAVRTRAMANRWAYDHVVIDAFTQGHATGRIGGNAVAIGPGDCVMLDLRGPMNIRVDDYRCVSLVMPRSLFNTLAGGYLAVDGLVFEADSPEAKLLVPALEHLVAEAPRLSEDLAAALGTGMTGLVAACARARLPMSRGPKPRSSLLTLAHLRRTVGRRAADPAFEPKVLATQLGISRATLSRIFEPTGGIAQAIRQARVDLAMRRLQGAETAPLSSVARESGFMDAQALRRALKAVYGLTPREAREVARSLPEDEQTMAVEWAAYLDGMSDRAARRPGGA